MKLKKTKETQERKVEVENLKAATNITTDFAKADKEGTLEIIRTYCLHSVVHRYCFRFFFFLIIGRKQQGRQRVRPEFQRHCVLSGGTQRRALRFAYKREEIKIYI